MKIVGGIDTRIHECEEESARLKKLQSRVRLDRNIAKAELRALLLDLLDIVMVVNDGYAKFWRMQRKRKEQ